MEAITAKRLSAYDHKVGESFFDQENPIVLAPFCGFLMCKRPTDAKAIIKILNAKYGEVQSLEEIYREEQYLLSPCDCGDCELCIGLEDEARKMFYADVSEFVNLAENTQARIDTLLKEEGV